MDTAEQLDQAYLSKRDPAPDSSRREFWSNTKNLPSRADQIAAWYGVIRGTPSAIRGQRHRMDRVGAIALLWACYHCAHDLAGKSLPATKFAEQARQYLPRNVLGSQSGEQIKRLTELLRLQAKPYPPVENAQATVDAIIQATGYFARGLTAQDVRTTIEDAGGRLSPGKLYCALMARAEATAGARVQLQSFVHPNLPIENSAANPSRDQLRRDLEDGLRKKDCRVQVIVGPDFGGKSTVVREYLRELGFASHRDKRTIQHPDLELSIFAMSGRDVGYVQLIYEVYKFLVQNPLERRARIKPANPRVVSDPEDMLRAIEEAAATPALYIFTDLRVFDPGEIQRAVNGRGTRRLVEILAERSEKTRIILTSSHAPSESDLKLNDYLLNARTILIEPPTLLDLAYFVPNTWADDAFAILRGLSSCLEDVGDVLERRIAGHLLQACASTINIIGRADAELLERLWRTASLSERSAPRDDVAQAPFFERMWELLRGDLQPNLLRALYLLCASDDGYAKGSLLRALDAWSDLEGPCGPAGETLFAELDHLSKASNERLLMLSDSTRIALDECDPAEAHSIGEHKTLPGYHLDPPIQRHLSEALRAIDPAAYRIAYRLTGNVARERALNIKLNLRRLYGTESKDMRRDLQALSCVLASLSEPTGRVPCPGPAGIVTESDVFAVRPRATPEQVVRYAWQFVIRREIDWDDRLLMILDEDGLKLDLLLGLIAGIGRRFWGSESFQPPVSLPVHLRGALSDKEIAELLVSVSLCAHFCNRRDLCEWADRMLAADGRPLTDPELHAHIHLKCILVDNQILQGNGSADRVGDLELLRRETLGPSLEATGRISDPLLRAMSRQRLQRRLFQIATTIDRLDRPESAARANVIIDDIFATRNEIVSLSGDYAAGFVGRTAVSLLRSLFGDPVFEDGVWKQLGWTKERTMSEFGNLLASAAGRLSRYSGAERANVAICKAYHSAITGDYEAALYYSQMAHDRVELPKVSPAFEANVAWGQAQIEFLAAEQDGDDHVKLLRRSLETAARVHSLARRAGFFDLEARSTLLMSKIALTADLPRGVTGDRQRAEARRNLERLFHRKREFTLRYLDNVVRNLLSIAPGGCL